MGSLWELQTGTDEPDCAGSLGIHRYILVGIRRKRKALVLIVVTFSNGQRKNKKETWRVLSWNLEKKLGVVGLEIPINFTGNGARMPEVINPFLWLLYPTV